MTPDQIHAGHTYAGKGSDCDKTRRVDRIEGGYAETRVFGSIGQDLGESVVNLKIFAQWAGEDLGVVPQVAGDWPGCHEPECPDAGTEHGHDGGRIPPRPFLRGDRPQPTLFDSMETA